MDDDGFRDLQERSQLVSDLASHPGWEMLVDRAKEDLWEKQKTIMGGKLPDYENYKAAVAWMEGAKFVLSIPAIVQEALKIEQIYRQELELAEMEEV